MGYFAYAVLNGIARRSSAVSDEAMIVSKSAVELVERAKQTQVVLGSAKQEALSDLSQLAVDASFLDWDGNGGEPVLTAAVSTAEFFLLAIPPGISMPEMSVGPRGTIIFEWTFTQSRRISLRINDSLRIAFAWLDGADCGHAVARFDGCELPPRILNGIRTTIGV
jgi:hypothetical protein